MGVSFKNLFNMTDDSDLFHTREGLENDGWTLRGNVFVRNGRRMLPVYEGKMVHHFDHRWNSYKGLGSENYERLPITVKRDAHGVAQARYWVQEEGLVPTLRNGKEVKIPGVSDRLHELNWHRDWAIGSRDICRTTDERTAIPAFLPKAAVSYTFPLMLPSVSPKCAAALVSAQSSIVFDYIARQKVGGIHMNRMVVKQLPVPTPATLEPHLPFLLPRVLELVYTAYDMTPLARDLGDEGEPFRWDEERRAQLRAELDAYFFHLYGISREDTDYILESFQSESGGLKNNEIAKFGEYRTKRLVLAEYDRMATAGLTLETPLDEEKPGSVAYRSPSPRPLARAPATADPAHSPPRGRITRGTPKPDQQSPCRSRPDGRHGLARSRRP